MALYAVFVGMILFAKACDLSMTAHTSYVWDVIFYIWGLDMSIRLFLSLQCVSAYVVSSGGSLLHMGTCPLSCPAWFTSTELGYEDYRTIESS